MPALSREHQVLFQETITAVKKAGQRIMNYYGKGYAIYEKDLDPSYTGNVVTQADHDAQRIILDIIKDGKAVAPYLQDVAFLAEEMEDYSVSKRFEKDYCFLIDPLDGTRGFINRTNSFAVSVGFIKQDGTPVFGVALLPAYQQLFAGIHQHQTYLNEKLLSLDIPCCGELVLWISEAEIFAAERNRVWHQVCQDIKAKTGITKIRPACIASPVHKGCTLVSFGTCGIYLGLPRQAKGVSLWDLAAIASIVTGAGGWVSDVDGRPLELNRKESIYAHHRGFLMTTHAEIAEVVLETWKTHFSGMAF